MRSEPLTKRMPCGFACINQFALHRCDLSNVLGKDVNDLLAILARHNGG
jgi:hypothetical protein